jgi:hypothetical protein
MMTRECYPLANLNRYGGLVSEPLGEELPKLLEWGILVTSRQ